jgi:hypothetical protein
MPLDLIIVVGVVLAGAVFTVLVEVISSRESKKK